MGFKPAEQRQGGAGLKAALKDRPRMLEAGVRWSARLLIIEGALHVLSTTLFTDLSFMRSHPMTLPPLASLGPALIALGYFAAAAHQDPRKYRRVVDALILFSFGRLITLFWNVADVPEIMRMEWIFAGLSALSGAWLIYYRVRAYEMAGEENAPLEVKDFWGRVKLMLADFWQTKKAPRGPGAPKNISESQPRMD